MVVLPPLQEIVPTSLVADKATAGSVIVTSTVV